MITTEEVIRKNPHLAFLGAARPLRGRIGGAVNLGGKFAGKASSEVFVASPRWRRTNERTTVVTDRLASPSSSSSSSGPSFVRSFARSVGQVHTRPA
mmetsp:Transcript_5914/g.14716  ORF Transcript_5914/g.14716 Transcript_5914/m.14716 type:complete len:97 (+) Transcript_5914:54-344(+)